MPRTENGFRIAHLTDIHVREVAAVHGLVETLHRVREANVDAILLGGDTIMNSVGATLSRLDAQWAEWHRAREVIPDIPIYSCLGNQDVWGWNQKASGCTGDEPLFGKGRFMHEMGLNQTYYATKIGGWRLIVLDSIQRGGPHGFVARLAPTQREWLATELATDQSTPTLVMSHIPIVPGPAEFFAADVTAPEPNSRWSLPPHLFHADTHDLTTLFSRFPNVRLCLSGHTHVPQRLEFREVTYAVSPPVSGAWWRGDYLGLPRGFSLVELNDAGHFSIEAVHMDPPP